MDGNYRSILVDNKTTNADITLFIYRRYGPLRRLSKISKIIHPGAMDIYRSEKFFQFKLKAHGEKTKRKIIFPTTISKRDYILRVTGSLGSIDVKKEDLSKHHREKEICIRRNNMIEETTRGCGRNLYEVLQVNIDDFRKEKDIKEQNARIRKAYHQQLLKWHPDKNPDSGDAVICQEIMSAYNILSDPESRAKYNNETDHNKGWLSKSRWKAIFNPECYTEKQRRDYWKRIVVFGLSGLLTGLALGALIASFFCPPIPFLTLVIQTVLAASGRTLLKTFDRESITEEFSLIKAAAGFAACAVGGALAGLTGLGISHLVLKIATTITGQCLAMGSGSGAAEAAILSVTNDLTRKYIDKEEVTWKEVLGHLIVAAIIGATAGLVGGAITKQIVKPVKPSSKTPKPVSASVEGTATGSVAVYTLTEEVVQSATATAGTKTAGEATKKVFIQSRGKMVGKVIAEEATAHTLQFCETVAEERLNKSVENRPLSEHGIDALARAAPQMGIKIGIEGGKEVWNKFKNRKIKEPKAEVVRRSNPKCEPKFEVLKSNKSHEKTPNIPSLDSLGIGDCTYDNSKGRIRFISKGWWWHLKMIVRYKTIEGMEEKPEPVIGDDCSIEIPKGATNIEVRFQVLRFIRVWCDVKKYDRDKKCWCKPTQPHIFTFNSPPNRVFTIDGLLYREAVVKVTEDYVEVKDN